MSKYVHCLQVFSHADTTQPPNDNIIILASSLTEMFISASSFYLYPMATPAAPLSPIHHYERDIWSVIRLMATLPPMVLPCSPR